MANTKITALTELAETPASTDMFPIVDISDTTMAATGTTKKLAGSRIVFQDSGTATVTTLLAPTHKAASTTNGALTLNTTNTGVVPVIDFTAGTANGLIMRATDVTTDATNKATRWACRHYTNAEEDFLFFLINSTSTGNQVAIGGNSASFNSATIISFHVAANNTTVTGTEMMRVNSNGVGVGTTSPSGLQVNQSTTETARTADNVRLGVVSGVPTIVLEDSGNTQTVIKNVAGITSIGKPGTPQLSIDTATGIATFVAAIDIGGTVQMDGLRVDITPTLSSQAQTHYINVNMNGTTYKLLLAS